MVKFELYTRTGCHLCAEMEDELASVDDKYQIEINTIIINDNKQLEEMYGDKVPVLAVGKTTICEYVLNLDALSKAIKHYS